MVVGLSIFQFILKVLNKGFIVHGSMRKIIPFLWNGKKMKYEKAYAVILGNVALRLSYECGKDERFAS
jgi:hypothetical protein